MRRVVQSMMFAGLACGGFLTNLLAGQAGTGDTGVGGAGTAAQVPGVEAADVGALNREAIRILTSRCSRCHGGNVTNAGLDVLNSESMLADRGVNGNSSYLIVPGDSAKSLLWQIIEARVMPQDDSAEAEAMTDEERESIRKWIDAGAEYPRRAGEFLPRKTLYQAAEKFIGQLPREDRTHFRFFSFEHLAANAQVSEQLLRYHRAALAKILNSLVFKRTLPIELSEVPETNGTLYAFDLRQLDWTADDQWRAICDHNPYGVNLEFAANQELRRAYLDLRDALDGEGQPIIRGDWFVVYGSQHPLYTKLLDLPTSLKAFEERLGVDFNKNFAEAKVARSGFSKSGISRQNRLIERHEGVNGYVWLSYDFKPRRARGDLVQFPLGPEFPENAFGRQAFVHDGGEMIFRLPNGLQGYMLVLGDGQRLDEDAPTEIVFDSSGVTGSIAIRNGISCMNCHARGMISGFRDDVRSGLAVGGDVQQFVERVYLPQDKMEALIEGDRQGYVSAEQRITGKYLQPEDTGEPVGKVAVQYYKNIDLEAALCELGLDDPQALRVMIAANQELQGLGFGRFEQQPPSNIQRMAWESGRDLSRWQRLYSAIERGAMPIKAKDLPLEQAP